MQTDVTPLPPLKKRGSQPVGALVSYHETEIRGARSFTAVDDLLSICVVIALWDNAVVLCAVVLFGQHRAGKQRGHSVNVQLEKRVTLETFARRIS